MISDTERALLATLVVMHTLCLCFIVARVYVRCRTVKALRSEDYLMLGAFVFSLSMLGVHGVVLNLHAIGIPRAEMDDYTRRLYRLTLWLLSILYSITLTLCKLSILTQYLRVFGVTSLAVRRLCQAMLFIVGLLGSYAVLSSLLLCIPPSYLWGDAEEARCMDRTAVFFSQAALNIVTDVVIFALPLRPIRRLRLPSKQKFALTLVFVLGFFVCITSVIRLVGLYEITQSSDRPKNGVSIAIWSTIEINTAIICGSLPMLKPLYTRIFPCLAWANTDVEPPRSIRVPTASEYARLDRPAAEEHHLDTLATSVNTECTDNGPKTPEKLAVPAVVG